MKKNHNNELNFQSTGLRHTHNVIMLCRSCLYDYLPMPYLFLNTSSSICNAYFEVLLVSVQRICMIEPFQSVLLHLI